MKKRNIRLSIEALIAALFLMAPAARAQPAANPSEAARALAGFDKHVEETLKLWNVPGVAVSVVKDGKVVLARGYGVRSAETRLPMTEDTLFSIASMTKAFTSFSVGLLVDEGKLSFDKPVASFLPGFSMHDPATTAQVTLRDIMSHRTGLPRHDWVWHRNEGLSRAGLLERLPHLLPAAPIRTSWKYNNFLYSIPALSVEHVTGQPLEEFAAKRVFEPLGMFRTTFSVEKVFSDPNRITGSAGSTGKLFNIPLVRNGILGAPSGGIYSTAKDLARWMLVQTGTAPPALKIIRPATLAETQRSQMMMGLAPTHPEIIPGGYGMGWFNYTYRGTPMIVHGGNQAGLTTQMAIFPEHRLGITVLANQGSSGLPEALIRTIADRLIDLSPIEWAAMGLQRKLASEAANRAAGATAEAVRAKDTKPSAPLSAYAGSYFHPGYGRIVIENENGALSGKFNIDSSPLEHWHYEVFRGTSRDGENFWSGNRIQFQRDERGRIVAASMSLEAEVAPISFAREPDAQLSDPAYLEKFVGLYDMGGISVQIDVSGNKLQWIQQGGGTAGTLAELTAGLGEEFIHPRQRHRGIRFVQDGSGRVTGFQIVSASGITLAKKIG